MENSKELKRVGREDFYTFLLEHKLKEIQGGFFHSSYFVNEQNEKLAYMETSSWGAETIYKVKVDSTLCWDNIETATFINNRFLKQK